MANSITLSKEYISNLDEVYKLASLTADLEGNTADIRNSNAGEICVPVLTMDGLSDYSRNSGYTSGSVTLTYETLAYNYKRGKKLSVDYLDNEQTAGVAFGKLDAEFIRTKVVPEHDAFVFATLAGTSGIGTVAGASLTTGEAVVKALRAGIQSLDDAEVPYEDRILYITPALLGLVEDMETIQSRATINSFAKVVKVPQSRFYTGITLGTNGYTNTGVKINFLIAHKGAVLDYMTRSVGQIITPEANQDADSYILKRREEGIVKVYPQKVAGIYLHKQAS